MPLKKINNEFERGRILMTDFKLSCYPEVEQQY